MNAVAVFHRFSPDPGSRLIIDAPDDDPLVVAGEHVRWCRRQGMSPADIFTALELPQPHHPSWDDAVWALARACHELPQQSRSLGRAA